MERNDEHFPKKLYDPRTSYRDIYFANKKKRSDRSDLDNGK